MGAGKMVLTAVGYAARPSVAVVKDADLHPDWSTPGPATNVTWGIPRDPKIDVAETLKLEFTNLGLIDIPISKSGVVTSSQLALPRDSASTAPLKFRPVVTVTRGSDAASRQALGELGYLSAGVDPNVTDTGQVMQPGTAIVFKSQLSTVPITIDVYTFNGDQRDVMFMLIKIVMIGAQAALMALGYQEVTRVGTSEDEAQDPDLGPGVLYHCSLTYVMKVPDNIASVPALASLIKQSMTIDPPLGAGGTTAL